MKALAFDTPVEDGAATTALSLDIGTALVGVVAGEVALAAAAAIAFLLEGAVATGQRNSSSASGTSHALRMSKPISTWATVSFATCRTIHHIQISCKGRKSATLRAGEIASHGDK